MTPPIPARPALFLDVDGTLLPIATRPADVKPDSRLLDQLDRLSLALDGACALVSGRTIAELSTMFWPLKLPAAGIHGLERRRADGWTVRDAADSVRLDPTRDALALVAKSEPALFIEDKGNTLAAHFRDAPHCEPKVREIFSRVANRRASHYEVQEGLHVLELKPAGINKGTALAEFMAAAPFAGRTPVAAGDDLSDVHAFRAAEKLGGFGIAVGDRVPASWRMANPGELRSWLAAVLDSVQPGQGGHP